MNKKINPCGNSMRELSTEELVNIYGADTATPISTIPCSVAKTVSVVWEIEKQSKVHSMYYQLRHCKISVLTGILLQVLHTSAISRLLR